MHFFSQKQQKKSAIMKTTDYQTITELIEDLKKAGLVYNDADFCRKVGISTSFVSEMKSGKKAFTPVTRAKIEETFPQFFSNGEHQDDAKDMDRLISVLEKDHELIREITRKQDSEIDRLLSIVEAMTGAAKKEKSA